MPGSQFREDDYVRCPFYTKETPIEVRCVGYYGEHDTRSFRSKAEKEDHKEDFCCGNFYACVHYQELEERLYE